MSTSCSHKCTLLKYCISLIVLNLLDSLFAKMVSTIYETMKIPTLKSTSGKNKDKQNNEKINYSYIFHHNNVHTKTNV